MAEGNPFDTPLQSEMGEHQQQQATTQQASSNGNPFDEPLLSEKAENQGTMTNDVGNTVIVPKEGESFSDTMARAAKQGQRTTPEQVNKELATAPAKAATVLGAAPIIGAGGAAALAAPGEIADAIPNVVDKAKAVVEWAKTNPLKAASIEAIAHEMGVDPFQLMHQVTKYGKNLFGVEEKAKSK